MLVCYFEIQFSEGDKQERFKMASSEEFRIFGKEIVDYIADYTESQKSLPPLPDVEPRYLLSALPKEAPLKPETFDDVMKDFKNLVMPGITQWHSPHFHAYYPIGNSYPSMLGEDIL